MSNAFQQNDVVTEYAETLIRVKAKQLVRRPGFCRSDQEDIEQDLVLHLLRQAGHFDPDRGSLNTFVARVVDSAIAMLVRDRGRAKRCPEGDVEVQSLSDKVDQLDGPPESLTRLIGQIDLERRIGVMPLTDAQLFELVEDVASVILTMPPTMQDICRSLFVRNQRETEEDLGVSRRRLKAAMELIGEHFEKSGVMKT